MSETQPFMCAGCGKVVSGDPPEQCEDCGGAFSPASESDLACDACGGPNGLRVVGERLRLCAGCLQDTRTDAILENVHWLVEHDLEEHRDEAIQRIATIKADAGAMLRALGEDDPWS